MFKLYVEIILHFIDSSKIDYLKMHKLSQDHLELFAIGILELAIFNAISEINVFIVFSSIIINMLLDGHFIQHKGTYT